LKLRKLTPRKQRIHQIARRLLKWAIPFVAVPALVMVSALVFVDKQYLLLSFGIALLSLILFWCGYERKITGSRRMVLAAIMTALCVVGRLIPLCKPVSSLVILTGIYLGRETGFLVGALCALFSNFYFGQGPWTPFQMLAWGMVGLLAGILSKPLHHRPFLLLYGAISGVFFSGVMDVWTVLWYNGTFSIPLYGAAMITALPFTILYAVSNVLYLLLLARPFGKKLERIILHYRI